MKYSAFLVSALAVLAKAAVQLTNTQYTVTEGQPFTLTWTGSEDPVTIKLKSGASNDLKDVETITSSGSGGSYTWTPETSLPSGTYAFEITDSSGQVNYSPQFSYQGSGTASVTTSTAVSTTASTKTTQTSASSNETKSTTSSARLTSSTMTPLTNSTTLSTSTSASASTSKSLTTSTTSSSATSSTTQVPNSNNGHRVASSLALVLGAVAAFIAFN